MLTAGFAALLSHWRRKPFQLLALVAGLALATALWTGVQAINAEARASYDRAAAALGERRHDQLLPRLGEDMDQEVFVRLRRAGWLASPVIEARLPVDGESLRLIGIEPLTAPEGILPAADVSTPDLAAFMTPPGRLLAGPETAARMEGAFEMEVMAVDDIAPGVAFGDIGIVQDILGKEGRVTRLVLSPDQPATRQSLDAVAPELELRRAGDGRGGMAGLTDSFHLNLTAFGLLSFGVGLFIAHGAIGLAFEQRRPMFRTLRALGLPLRSLFVLLAAEMSVFAMLSGAIGTALGYLIAAALLPDVAATLRGLYGAEVDGALSLRPVWWLAGLAIAFGGAAIASVGAFASAARMPLLAPARPRAWARFSEGRIRRQSAIALALAILALAAGHFGDGLVMGFAMLGGLLLAAALVLPAMLHGVLALAEAFALRPLVQWFVADTRQQLPGLSLALMALLLALAANIGVGTMVASFRLAFVGWLDQRLASELYVSAESETDSSRLRAFLESRADAVLPIWNAEGRLGGRPVEIYGIIDHSTYREAWPLVDALPDVWDRVYAGEVALINEQLSLRENLRPGDTVALPGGWTPVVGGIYGDYGNVAGQAIVALEELEARFPEISRRRFGVRVAPAAASELARELREDYGLPEDNIVDQASLKSFSLRVFERAFAVTGALNILTLAVAGFAILTSLLTLAAMRLPQLAPIWALGLSRRRLARLELLRAALLAALTMLAAVPAGLALAWILLTKINVVAFGWRLPMHVFPLDWLALFVLSLAVAALAALWPAQRLASTPPAELLKVFANER